MIPEGWSRKRLGNIAEFQRGFDLPKQSRMAGNVPIVSSSGFTGNHNLARVKGPGIVTGRYGSIGEVFKVDEDYWPLNTTLWVKNFHGNNIDFVYYLLQRINFEKFSDKTGVPGINRNDIHAIQQPLPPLPEQEKIAEILGTWDEAIEVAEKQLENAKTQKRALMQQLLTGKRRFPEFEGQKFRDVKLGDISTSWSGGTPSRSKPEYYNGSIPWIKSGEVNAARVTETAEHITETALVESSASLVKPDTILIAMYGATAGVVSISGITAAINQAILAVAPNPNISSSFLFHAVETAMKKTTRLTQGGQPNLNASIIRCTKLWLPSLAEQQKIASAISSAQVEVTSLSQKIDCLRSEKKALMQQLLTGKKRVKV